MKLVVRLTLITLGMVILLSLYFEYCVSRPLNVYLQYAATAVVILISVYYLVYLIRQIVKLFNP